MLRRPRRGSARVDDPDRVGASVAQRGAPRLVLVIDDGLRVLIRTGGRTASRLAAIATPHLYRHGPLILRLVVLGSLVLAASSPSALHAQANQSDGDCFGGCGADSTSLGSGLSASISAAICPYASLIRFLAMAIAVLGSMHAAFRAAQGEHRKWVYALVLLLTAGFLVGPRSWFSTLGLNWMINILDTYYRPACGI